MRRPALAILALSTACVGPPSAPAAPDPWAGGSVTMPGCGDQFYIGYGATQPTVAGDTVGPDPTPWQVHLGLTMDPRTSIAIVWRTRDETTERTAVVIDGVRHTGVVWQHRDIDELPTARMHEVHVCGLEPDTVYSYRIEGDPAAETGSFRTAPDLAADPSAEVVVLVLGDSRGGADVLAQLLARADEAEPPDLILFTGDAVLNGARQQLWDDFYAAGEALFRRVPMIHVIGNHEDGDIIAFSSWALPGDEKWFSLDYGAAHVAVVDDSPWLSPDLDGHGAAFLNADLPVVPADRWRVVMHHQPLYSSIGRGSTQILRERWESVFDQHDVDLVLSGHNHGYERTVPILGVTYVVTAGAGAPLYELGASEWTAVSEVVHHTMTLRIRVDSITAQAVDVSGAILDEFSLDR